MPPLEENADLPDFRPESAHLLLWEVYGDFPHHNDGSHLDRGFAENAIWQRRWRWLVAQSASWYDTPSGAVGRRFTAILAAQRRGVLVRSRNSERPLFFAHVVLTKMLAVCRAKEIRARITSRMYLWDRGLHAGLVGDAKAEGATREGRATSDGEEEDEVVSRSYNNTVLSCKLQKPIRKATNREGEGCNLLNDKCTKTGRLVVEVLWDNHADM